MRKQIYAKEYGSREEAFFIEQSVLAETLEYAYAPEELVTVRWAGFQEIRKMAASDLVRVFEYYNEQLEEMGIWRFAAAYVSMTESDRQECILRSSAE